MHQTMQDQAALVPPGTYTRLPECIFYTEQDVNIVAKKMECLARQ